jgi:hypothetical protein
MALKANRDAIASANAAGFVVNLSGNNPSHADTLAALEIAPVVTIASRDLFADGKVARTPAGRTIVRCPAEYRDTSCAECAMCALPARDYVIGFTVHGAGASRADIIARG